MDRRIIISLVLALAAAPVHAESDWATLTRGGEYAFARGFMERAEAEFQAALAVAQGFPPGDRRLELSLDNLARLYEHQSEFAKALPLYQLRLAAAEVRLGEQDPGLLDPLYDVARVSQPLGDLPTVDASLRHFDDIATASGAADAREWWQVLAMLSRLEVIRDNPEQALTWQRRAAEVLDRDEAASPEERAVQLESLARLELESGEGERAEALFVQVAEMRATADGAAAFAPTMADGAVAAFAAGRFETAERLAMAVLDLGPDAESARRARSVLADVSWARVSRGTDELEILLAASGDDAELALAAERLRALVETVGGSDRETLRRLVQVEALRGRPGEAALWQRQLMTNAPSGDTALAARRDLATLLTAAGDYAAALPENTAVLNAMESRLGADDRQLLPLLEQRLAILERTGPKKEAKQVAKRIKKILR